MDREERNELRLQSFEAIVERLVEAAESYDDVEDFVGAHIEGEDYDAVIDAAVDAFNVSRESAEKEADGWIKARSDNRAESRAERQAFGCDL